MKTAKISSEISAALRVSLLAWPPPQAFLMAKLLT
jgi:hypothetical protein